MGFIGGIIDEIAKAVPILVQKIATTLLTIFLLGVLFGFFVVPSKGPLAIAGLAFVLFAMFYKLDEGFLLLVIYFMWVFLF